LNIKHIHKTHTLQLDESDCGVACLLSVIKFYNGDHTLEKLRELSGTTTQGTTMLGLYKVANELGFTAEGVRGEIQALKEHGEPVILHFQIVKNNDHYVVCYDYDKQKGFLIGDPDKGIYYLNEDELEKNWVSKNCLVLSPNENFITTKEAIKSQKKYFFDLLKEDYKLLVFSVVIGVFVAGLGMAMSIFSQKLIDDILPSHKINKLITGIILLAILLLSRVGFMILREFFLLQQSKDFNNRINNQFYSSLLHLPKPFFDTRKIGELVARLNDTGRIQSVIKMLASNLVIDVLVKTDVAGDYTIAIDHVDGLFSGGQDIILKDNTTGTETDLKAGAYTFAADAGVDKTRFVLKYQKNLGINSSVFDENGVTVYKNKGTLYVNSDAVAIANIKVFDIQGRLIAEQKNVKANSVIVKNLKATQQVLIVKITSQDNKVVSKKVVN